MNVMYKVILIEFQYNFNTIVYFDNDKLQNTTKCICFVIQMNTFTKYNSLYTIILFNNIKNK